MTCPRKADSIILCAAGYSSRSDAKCRSEPTASRVEGGFRAVFVCGRVCHKSTQGGTEFRNFYSGFCISTVEQFVPLPVTDMFSQCR